MLGNMLPRPPFQGFGYGCSCDVEIFSDFGVREFARMALRKMGCALPHPPNLFHGCIAQLGSWNTLSARSSAFGAPVCGIIRIRAKKQVLRIAARPIVAAMAYAQACWNWAVRKNPCHAMCEAAFKLAIAFRVATRFPFPTGIRRGFFNFLPKPILDRSEFRHGNASVIVRVQRWVSSDNWNPLRSYRTAAALQAA